MRREGLRLTLSEGRRSSFLDFSKRISPTKPSSPGRPLTMDLLFEFDCPKDFIDLDQENIESNALWFMISHPLHEKKNSSLIEETQPELEGSKVVVPLVQFRKKASIPAKSLISADRSNRKASASVSDIPLTRKRPLSNQSSNQTEEKDMLNLLRRHNERFVPVTKYEPSRHSVRDVRKWEKISGKEWATLSAEARIGANEEIMKMKKV
jgi:hypothetical protein